MNELLPSGAKDGVGMDKQVEATLLLRKSGGQTGAPLQLHHVVHAGAWVSKHPRTFTGLIQCVAHSCCINIPGR